MNSKVQVHLFGSLKKKLKNLPPDPIELDLNIPMPLDEVLENLKIPTDMVQLVMVNHKAVPKDSVIQPRDRLSLFPREYPFFHDWKDMRF
jgi:sulfur carrier protein ThiS